jgi:hypothetical protein
MKQMVIPKGAIRTVTKSNIRPAGRTGLFPLSGDVYSAPAMRLSELKVFDAPSLNRYNHSGLGTCFKMRRVPHLEAGFNVFFQWRSRCCTIMSRR